MSSRATSSALTATSSSRSSSTSSSRPSPTSGCTGCYLTSPRPEGPAQRARKWVMEQINILIVEDREEDAELAGRELRKGAGTFTSTRVETRDEYLRALSDFAPDVILSDFSLPQFNGLAALRLLRERELDVPFILITGSMTEEV